MNREENNIGIIIPTRLQSSRMHEKILEEINGKTCFEILLDHVINDKYEVVVAVPNDGQQQKIIDIAKSKGIEVFQGSFCPSHRLLECAEEYCFDHIIRITHDDILIDLTLLFLQIDFHIKGNRDYTYMSKCPEGIAGEVISVDALRRAVKMLGDKFSEFTSYYLKLPENNWIEYFPPFEYQHSFRLTMDYEEDLTLLRVLFSLLKRPGTLDIINLLKQNKYLLRINKQTKITVYTTAYNVEKYIQETMKSVINQTFDDWEYIIIDDCSTDKTCEKIAEYLETLHYNERRKIQFVRNPENRGQAFNSNKALEMSRGKYIVALDADDVFCDTALQTMHDVLEESHDDVCMAGYERLDEESNQLAERVEHNTEHLGSALINKRLINELKFKSGLRYKIGGEFLDRLKQHCTIAYYKDVLWYYRKRNGQLTQEAEHPDNV
jgi:spore coat polysaccharide biosynthesis protein SpsF (cytidylyltransferase family)